jgi:predicted transcriptional regulator of viral defense system
MKHQNELSIGQWLDILQGRGVLSFSVEQLKQEIVGHTDIAIKRALSRLSSMGKIVSIHKGYYLILPPQYSIKGVLPPQLYLDAFMRHLKRTYYVSLLNAAAYHGASHQQPQEYFVTTTFPVIRPTQKKGLKINYVCIKEIPLSLLEMRKTEAGYLTISNAALTACDLVQFEKRIGGLQRAVSVLEELVEVIQPTDFTTALLKHAHVTTLQRLGYLVELMGGHQALAEGLFESMKREKMTLFRIPLKSSKNAKGFSSDNRWKVIVNNEIDLDE